MSTFTIDDQNNVTVFATLAEAALQDAEGSIPFESQAALAESTTDWPLARFVEIWNGIPGQQPVKKFQDRKKAIARIWAAIQSLAGAEEPTTPKVTVAKPGRKVSKAAKKIAKKAPPAKKQGVKAEAAAGNKKAAVIALMRRSKGATLAEIMEATQWQAHTVRGFVSILGSKGGLTIESSKNSAGERSYHIPK